MKKFIVIFGIILVILFTAILVLPIVFKDEIKAAIDKALAESVNADIVWEADDFSLSLLSNFPNVSAHLSDIGIVNRAPFEGEILFLANEIEVEIDLFSLFGDQIRVVGVGIKNPVVNILIDEEGRANYDISIDDNSETGTSSPDSTSFNLGIDHWYVTGGSLSYYDATFPMRLSLKNINHEGNGDFTQVSFDLRTNTRADSFVIEYDGIRYIQDKVLDADVVMNISDNYSTYTFRENTISINDFKIGVDGIFKMLDEGYDMDLTFAAKDNSFKSLLSLVPGIYTSDFDRIQANGTLDFAANAKGTYNDERLPAFSIKLFTQNSMFQYPDLPRAVENITIDALVENKDGILENTSVDISKFHLDFGQNPVDATLKINNLRNYEMAGHLKASLNFEELTTIFPVEGNEIRGTGMADLTFSGIYDSVRQIMPSIKGSVGIENGYIKSADLPYALEKVRLKSEIENPTGEMKDFKASINPFSMQLDGAPFKADGKIANLENYTWDLNAQGSVDLKKLAAILKLTDMELEGQLMADVHTKGNMEALEKERYAELPTSGDVTLRNFLYNSSALPAAFKISEAALTFDPARMNLVRFDSRLGDSDFKVTGYISNYIGYALGEGKTLRGELDVNSTKIDLNQFMTEEDPSATASVDSALSVILVPADIDFVVNARANEVLLTNMRMTNAQGRLIIKDQTVSMNDFRFNMLGGAFSTSGSYSTVDPEKPSYDLAMDVKEVRIAEAFSTFDIVRGFVPIANQLIGTVSTDVKLSGLLLQDMSPDLLSVDVDAMVEVLRATLEDSDILKGISSVTSLEKMDQVVLRDLIMNVTIEDGKLKVDPFDIKMGDYDATIQGTTALDGSIAYQVSMLVPAGKMGSQLNAFLAENSKAPASGDLIPVTLGIGGTYKKPETMLLMDEQKALIEAALKQKATEEAGAKAEDLLENVKDEKTREILGNILGKKTPADSTKSDSVTVPVEKKVQDEAVDKIKEIFKKKKKDDGGSN
ncbi:AsmA-like C-terminal region-containing protein [Fulvivirga sedimenti]|uniref:AsmA family protein n=1 Tax=Fulvivirga sedimenti TaxID=2879465 RepID=A0A9X1HY42_9BACT|nr:AsmA-like C-terminal region-containing protein [Fulvivirga sedimenti]MCA6078637.1 AsmA family protein [Fulvivirga sedimenti]